MPISKDEIRKMFSKPFDLESYTAFVGELFNQSSRGGVFMKPTGDDSYEFLRLMTYEDSSNKKLDVVVIKMKDSSSIERARTNQRNIISKNFLGYGSKLGIQDALIVFYNEKQPAWRFSYIKQEFEMDENGKIKDSLTPAKRFSFFVNPDLRNVTVKQNFRDLLNDTVTPTVAEIESAFSVEAVTKEFFKKYVEKYQYILELFKSDSVFQKIQETVNHGDEQFAENFVKKLLGQIVFIYFLQRKGWMGVEEKELRGNGRQTYLRDLYEECMSGGDTNKENGGVNYFNDYLEWLFYDTLNKQRDDHWSDYFTTKIPYLNGGLFEPVNGYNWKGPENIIFKGNEDKANKAFGDLLDVFDLFNFTVFENDPLEQDVAVDPEMLGKIFENLLPENERKGKGSFYTPRPIVHYMCKESLKQYLITKTGLEEGRIDKLIKKKDSMDSLKVYEKQQGEKGFKEYLEFKDVAQQIDKALAEVKIVDPAVGSGAFPMGILKEIVSTREYIQRSIIQNPSKNLRYDLKKEALQNSIYGVDIDPGAVEIAKLRFRLSLVVENDSQDIEPLPNLDYKFMQGNSLIDQLVLGDEQIDVFTDDDLNDSSTADKALYQSSLGLEDNAISNVLDELKYYHTKFFNTDNTSQKKELKSKIDDIERKLIRTGCEKTINNLVKEKESITTKYALSGVEVLDKDAKRLDEIQTTISEIKEMEEKFNKDQIRPFFPWKLHFGKVFKDNGGFDIVIGNPPYVSVKGIPKQMKKYFGSRYYSGKGRFNLFTIFIELSITLIKDSGNLSFIIPDGVCTHIEYRHIRDYIINNTKINYINSFSRQVFENASVDTVIMSMKKSNSTERYYKIIKDLQFKGTIINSNQLSNFPNIIFPVNLDNRQLEMLESHYGIDNKFGEFLEIQQGIIYSGQSKEEVFSEVKENDLYKKSLDGRDIKKWNIRREDKVENKYIKYTKKLHRPREERIFINDKIVFPRKSTKLYGAFDNQQYYCLNTAYVGLKKDEDTNLKYLLGIINSDYLNYIYSKTYMGWQITIPALLNLSVHKFDENNMTHIAIINLVDNLISNPNDQSSNDRLQEAVYKLYGLTNEEVELLKKDLIAKQTSNDGY